MCSGWHTNLKVQTFEQILGQQCVYISPHPVTLSKLDFNTGVMINIVCLELSWVPGAGTLKHPVKTEK